MGERKEYMKNYHKKYIRNKFGFPEPKIKDVSSLISTIKKETVNFPEIEFNKKLDEILQENHSEILEKKLKDIIYNILDKKGTMTTVRMLQLYHGFNWENVIEKMMTIRGYSKKDGDKYVKIQE
jgi:transcriptional regulator NrdR family protein